MSTREDLEATVTGQGALVRKLKKEKADVAEIKAAVAKLLELKTELAEKVGGRRKIPVLCVCTPCLETLSCRILVCE